MKITASINDHGLSKLLQKAVEQTKKTTEEFLHYHAQSLIYNIAAVTRKTRTTAEEAEADAKAHLTGIASPKGLFVRTSARRSAERLMRQYQKSFDEEQGKKKLAKKYRNTLILKKGKTNGFLKNTKSSLKKRKRVNVQAIAVEKEIKLRRKSGSALSVSFLLFYRKLRSQPLGQATRGSSSFFRGKTWKYSFFFEKQKTTFNLHLQNKTFTNTKVLQQIEAGFKNKAEDMTKHLLKQLDKRFKK